MNSQEIKERTEQIALMLGGKYERNENLSFEPKGRWNIPQFPDAKQDYDLKFHSDWNWLMEAVEFVKSESCIYWYPNSFCINEDITISSKRIVKRDFIRLPKEEKEAFFLAVSDYAKLYNTNKL